LADDAFRINLERHGRSTNRPACAAGQVGRLLVTSSRDSGANRTALSICPSGMVLVRRLLVQKVKGTVGLGVGRAAKGFNGALV
jgi:hypothetical protein